MDKRDVVVVMPVGTSVLMRWMKSLEPALKLPQGWAPGQDDGPVPDVDRWTVQLRRSLDAGAQTSAEIDALRAWIRRRDLDPGRIRRVELLVSDTDAARWVAEMLRRLLRHVLHDSVEVQSSQIEGLSPDDKKMLGGAALRDFILEASGAAKRALDSGCEPVLNATAGFKAETGLLTLLAAVLRVEVFYLHEQMKEAVVFPPLPIGWDRTVVTDEDVRRLAELGPATDELRLAQLIDGSTLARLWPFMEQIPDDTGGYIWARSALGELLLETLPVPLSEPDPRPEGTEAEVIMPDHEAGHRPAEADAVVRDIKDRFPFVTRIQNTGWPKAPLKLGVAVLEPGDIEKGAIRLRTPTRDGRKLTWILGTTAAGDEGKLRRARAIVAETYGWGGARDDDGADDASRSPAQAGSVKDLSTPEGRVDVIKRLMDDIGKLERSVEESESRASAANRKLARVRDRLRVLRRAMQEISESVNDDG